VFTRGDLPIDSLRDLRAEKLWSARARVAPGRIASQLLRANDITSEHHVHQRGVGRRRGGSKSGQADAAFLVLAADSDKIQSRCGSRTSA
jgi:hypothetical protein